MKDIKLMAWDEKTKEMLEISEAIFHEGEVTGYRAVGDTAISGWRGNDPIHMYAGFHDLNDKEVYTSFIVQHKERPNMTGIVRFAKGGFFAVGHDKDSDHQEVWSGLFIERKCIIIGNCYQNPELMPKTKQNVEKG